MRNKARLGDTEGRRSTPKNPKHTHSILYSPVGALALETGEVVDSIPGFDFALKVDGIADDDAESVSAGATSGQSQEDEN